MRQIKKNKPMVNKIYLKNLLFPNTLKNKQFGD